MSHVTSKLKRQFLLSTSNSHKRWERKGEDNQPETERDIQNISVIWSSAVTACCFGKTPLSPLLKVVLLHGSKLINLPNLFLSRWHYPDGYIYCCAFAVIPCDLKNVIHTPQGTGEDLPFHQLHFFYRPTPCFYPHQFLPHSLLNWSFHRTAPH